MSTIIGIVENGKVWIGADSRASTEDGDIRLVKCKKIFRNSNYLFAFIGSVRGGQILYPHYFEPPEDVWDLPDAIRNQCEKKGCLAITEQQITATICNYLIGHKGKLYEILIDFQMTEIPEYASVGSGSYYALGSLHTTNNMKNDFKPKVRIKLALEAAATFSGGTGKPFICEEL